MQNYDILCVVETHLDSTDCVDIPGYVFFSLPRSKAYRRKSGGIGLYVKDSISHYVKVEKNCTDYVLWLNIDKHILKSDGNLLLGAIYLPPENSRFYTTDDFDNFETILLDMCNLYEHVLLLGDFNSRTGRLRDYVPSDNFVFDLLDVDPETQATINSHVILENLGIPLNRCSKDNVTNAHGLRLIELCRNNNLFILNGRMGNERFGDYTFKDRSVIDYAIAKANLFENILDFSIFKPDPLLSDGHSMIKVIFASKKIPLKCTNLNRKRVRWENNKANEFLNNIDVAQIIDLSNQLNTFPQSQNTVEHITSELTSLFSSSADATFTQPSHSPRINNRRPWFGPACKRARKTYHRARTKYNRHPSEYNKTNLKNASKAYKRTIYQYVREYKHAQATKLRNMKTSNPKHYWNFLKKMKPKSKSTPSPTLNDFYEHFKNVNTAPDDDDTFILPDYDQSNLVLNSDITAEEVSKCIKSLNNGKSSSPTDNVLNEYIKTTQNIFLPLYVKLFNCVLSTGFIPVSWLNGVIIPIYKNKGDPLDTPNYRPITILSCLGKLFTSILNQRLTGYLNTFEILKQNQAGFRKGYSCSDHIFTLYSLMNILKLKKKKLFCAFIDFSSAFDKVHRVSLWRKLWDYNINGKLFQVIYNMYKNIKSCISHEGKLSSFFACSSGVRQGENLSPLLFSLFINDMEAHLENHGSVGVRLTDVLDETVWLKLLLFLYADDTIIVSDSPNDFQTCLNAFNEYCNLWHLNVNLNKTKIVVFGARNTNHFHFRLGNNDIEFTDKYNYLGVTFSSSGSFLNARKHVVEQAKKAMYSLFYKIRNADLPIDLSLKLFDHTVLPILTYGSEIFGFENLDMIESVHNEFLRKLLKARKGTPIYMLHGELGRHPVAMTIKSRMIGFWTRLINGNTNKLSYRIYQYMLSHDNNLRFKWLAHIKHTLDSVGLTFIWLRQHINVPQNLRFVVKQTLFDQYKQYWHSQLQLSNKGKLYSIYKRNLELENYLTVLPLPAALTLFYFRTANHKLPVETGRWDGTIFADRTCTLCNTNAIGTEKHYLLACPFFNRDRIQYLNSTNIDTFNSEHCFKSLLTSSSPTVLKQIAGLCHIIMLKFR